MKKGILLLGLVCFFLLLTRFYPTNKENLSQTERLTKVTITQYGQSKIFLYLPLYIAMEEGYFARNGLDVHLTYSGNDDQIAATVVGGYADFGVGDPIFSAIIQERGGQLKTIATLVEKAPFIGYTNKENIDVVKEITDFNNLVVSSFPAPSTLYTNLNNLKNAHNLNIDIKPVTFGAQMAALEAGEVDVAMDLDPNVAIAEKQGYKAIISLSQFLPPQAITGITTRQDFILKNPEIVQKVVDSLQQAIIAFYQDDDVGLRVAEKIFPNIEKDILVRAVNRSRENALYPRDLSIKDSVWQQGITERINIGDLKQPQETSVATDNTFADKAYKKYGK